MGIRLATMKDFVWLQMHDSHVSAGELELLIRLQRVLIAQHEDEVIGWLRWNMFWDNTPFMNLLYVLEGYRGKGVGTMLVREWEKLRLQDGYSAVMTSTQANETAQHFYRKLGYRDAGSLILPDEVLEIIFHKELT